MLCVKEDDLNENKNKTSQSSRTPKERTWLAGLSFNDFYLYLCYVNEEDSGKMKTQALIVAD